MQTAWDVIVVGGGLAGLTAGAVATAAGASTLVLEAHEPGGRARTTERQGFVFNMGAHALYAGGQASAVLRSLGITPRGAPPPLDRYMASTGGCLHQLPTGLRSLLHTTLLGWRGRAQFSKLLTSVPRLDPTRFAGRSVADWIGAEDLRPDVESVLRALLRLSTYAADLEDFGADAAIAQMQLAASAGVTYLDGGWSQLIDQLAARVELRGGVKVSGIEPVSGGVEVTTPEGTLVAGRAVLALGTPAAASALLPADPSWAEVGAPSTAACLDAGVRNIPSPGYVLGLDDPVYATVQGPPARQAPPGNAVIAALRYGTRNAVEDRAQLEALLVEAGVSADDVVVSRFLARMVVAGATPRAATGGLRGRPSVTSTGAAGVYLAGDWVGDQGLLADASMASGREAARLAVRQPASRSIIIG